MYTLIFKIRLAILASTPESGLVAYTSKRRPKYTVRGMPGPNI